MSRSYLQHGRRHMLTGSDPIPGLGGGSLAIATLVFRTGRTVTADNTNHYQSIQDGVSTGAFFTSDSTVFANQQTTIAHGGVNNYGLTVLVPGTYRMIFNCLVHGGTSGVLHQSYQEGDNGYVSFLNMGRAGALQVDGWDRGGLYNPATDTHLFWEEWLGVDTGMTPCTTIVYNKIASGTNPTVQWAIHFQQLSTSADTVL